MFQKLKGKENTFSAVPSLPWCLSRVIERIPYLEDFTSTHFWSSLKLSSNCSSSTPEPASFEPSVTTEAEGLSPCNNKDDGSGAPFNS